MADYTFNPKPKENAPQPQDPNSRGKPRIWNEFKSTIELDELSLPSFGKEGNEKTEDLASMEFPLIKINDYFISRGEIDSFEINCNDKVPKISLTATFSDDLFFIKNMPKDGDIISVAIRTKSDLLKPVRNDYVITGVITGKRNTDTKVPITITFFGSLFIPGWKGFHGNASKKGTSLDVLKRTAKDMGLGFNTNEEDTDDKQIWYNYWRMNDFFQQVTERAWKDENSFFDWWIDIYYNLNFVNIQKQLLASEGEIDEAAIINNVPKDFYWGSDEGTTVGTAKVFSNYPGFKTSSFYIQNWRPINRSSQITFEYGAIMACAFYEHNDILYEDPDAQKYWDFDVSPKYDPEKVNSHILLRGRPTYDSSLNNNEPARANYDYNELYKTYPWGGIQYTISNPDEDNTQWTGNQHRNYIRARIHNTINIAELEKLNVEIDVQGTNLNIIKGDKIPIVLIQTDRAENLKIQEDFDLGEALEFFYTGWYYVKGFSLSWKGGGYADILNSFSQNFLLTRREWPAPVPTESREKAKNANVKET